MNKSLHTKTVADSNSYTQSSGHKQKCWNIHCGGLVLIKLSQQSTDFFFSLSPNLYLTKQIIDYSLILNLKKKKGSLLDWVIKTHLFFLSLYTFLLFCILTLGNLADKWLIIDCSCGLTSDWSSLYFLFCFVFCLFSAWVIVISFFLCSCGWLLNLETCGRCSFL